MLLWQRLRDSRPFFLIAGVNVLEAYESTFRVASELKRITADSGIEFVFKASFDKANRTNENGFRGPGLESGLAQLTRIKKELGVNIITDVHERHQCQLIKDAMVDIIQIPAFLCRQTDLLHAAGDTGLPVMIKKGQFASADVMLAAKQKVLSRPNNGGVILCERGTSVGSDQLMVDFRNLVLMRSSTNLVVLDATHAAQRPAFHTREGKGSSGDLFAVQAIARAGAAVGVDGIFLEVHESPIDAPVDTKIQWPLAEVEAFLTELRHISNASQWRSRKYSADKAII